MTLHEKVIRETVAGLMSGPEYSKDILRGVCEATVANRVFQRGESEEELVGTASDMYLSGCLDGMCRIIADLISEKVKIVHTDMGDVGEYLAIEVEK